MENDSGVRDNSNNSGVCGTLDGIEKWFHGLEIKTLAKIIKVANISVAIVLALIYPYAFFSGGLKMSFQSLVLCAYAMIFSCLLLAFEFKVQQMHNILKQLFGFMFSFFGRTLFLCFIGTLAIAGNWYGCQLVGLFAMAVSLLNCCAIYNHPGYLEITQSGASDEFATKVSATDAGIQGGGKISQHMGAMEMRPVELSNNQSFVSEEDLNMGGAGPVGRDEPFSQVEKGEWGTDKEPDYPEDNPFL